MSVCICLQLAKLLESFSGLKEHHQLQLLNSGPEQRL